MSTLLPFQEAVNKALKIYRNPEKLGSVSPLATPYFLGADMPPNATSVLERGRVLQNVLQEATEQIGGEYAERWRKLIELRFFQEKSFLEISQALQISESQIKNTDRKRAIIQLAERLIERVKPSLRLEMPPSLPSNTIHRRMVVKKIVERLEQKQSVFVAGVEGLGKTSMGGQVAALWQSDAVFWYTVRVGLNDHIDSFVFNLAYFLYQQGASSLWQELIAAEGKVEPHFLEIARYSLAQLSQMPLLCVDEADVLQSNQSVEYLQLSEFWADLQEQVPILYMGQQPSLRASYIETLQPYSDEAAAQIFSERAISLSAIEIQSFNHLAGGNPGILNLAAAYLQDGGTIEELGRNFEQAPKIHLLMERVLRRLSIPEKRILSDLSVYDIAAPEDVWLSPRNTKAVQQSFTSLSNKNLIHFDGVGGVFILPAYRKVFHEILSSTLPEEELQLLHHQAAEVFIERGQFTQAARQYTLAGQAEIAIWQWEQFKQQEINQGQAYAAISLFQEMRNSKLSLQAHGRAMDHVAELQKLMGSLDQALESLESVRSRPPVFQIEALQLKGIILNEKSELTDARKTFADAVSMAEAIIEGRLAHLYKGLSWNSLREMQLERAWNEALMARYEADNHHGTVALRLCLYEEAEKFYLGALALAKEANHLQGVAKTHGFLSWLYAIQGKYGEALQHAEEATAYYEKTSQRAMIAHIKINIALTHNLAEQHQMAVNVLTQATTQLAEFGLPTEAREAALFNQGFAEAYLGLNQLDKATEHVRRALGVEEGDIFIDSSRTFGEILLKQGELTEAEKQIQFSIDLLTQNENGQDHYLLGYAQRSMAQVYGAQGRNQLAIEMKEKCIKSFLEINLPYEVERTKRLLNGL